MSDLTVSLKKTINAPIEKVFDAWLKPETISKFMMPMPGMKEPEVSNNPRVGGEFSIIMFGENEQMPHKGKYIEIARPNTLVFTWESAFSPADSKVSLLFTKIDETNTQIELTHVKFFNEETRTNHEGGWGHILEMLEQTIVE